MLDALIPILALLALLVVLTILGRWLYAIRSSAGRGGTHYSSRTATSAGSSRRSGDSNGPDWERTRTRERWDPYDPANSRQARVRSARMRAGEPVRGPDLYTLLGVRAGASDIEIERAYRALVVENHPDRFFGDPARRRDAEIRMKNLNEAMRILRDPLRRAKYDRDRLA